MSRADVPRLVTTARVVAIGGCEEILLQVGLTVGYEALAQVAVDIDEEALAAGPCDLHPIVLVPFPLHAARETVLPQHLDRRGLEDTGSDPSQHVIATVLAIRGAVMYNILVHLAYY